MGEVVDIHRRGANETGDEDVLRAVINGAGGIHLLQDSGIENGDAVTHGHRLGLVVGDIYGGGTKAALQVRDLRAGGNAQLGIQVGQRLVHAEYGRFADDGAAHGHALALAAGEVCRLAVQQVFHLQDLRRLVHA